MGDYIGVIRVLTLDDPEQVATHGRQIERKYGLVTKSLCIPDQRRGIYDDQSEQLAVPKIVALGRQMAKEGARAIVVSCAADPGVAELRAELKIPVIGAGSAASAVAISLAERVGVLNLTEGAPGPVRQILGERFVGEANPQGVRDTTDLMTDWGRNAALRAASRLIEAGAGSIVLACTGYTTIGFAPELRQRTGVIAVDAVDAAGLMAWFALA
ncbi:MAG: aspartate/glutamate racemase family protein [Dehalococcoidales bacterium]|nr:aspartate/glutamate racemase family protein [Dehalococcoidales bacterium]